MAKFRFRLETLLKLREAARDERRAELAQARQAEEILADRRRYVEAELQQLEQLSRAASSPGRIDVDGLLEARRYELVLRGHQRELERQRQTVEDEIQRRHRFLVEANREVRVLEQLREKQRLRHRHEENRRENKELDEVAARQAGREDAP